jgi:predicted nucleic acid-binding protein
LACDFEVSDAVIPPPNQFGGFLAVFSMNLLDTDVVIELLRERRYEAGSISIVTLIEVLRGLEVEKRGRVKKLLEETFNLQNLDNEIIETYCKIYHDLKEKATLIPDADLLVAATAIARNLTLKTHDEHFQRLEELGLRRAEA